MGDFAVTFGACLLLAAGWVVLAKLCSARDRCATLAMLHWCSLGMFAGFVIDVSKGGFALLTALCMSGERSVLYWAQLHWSQLPAMHVGMVIAGLLAQSLSSTAGLGVRGVLKEVMNGAACTSVMLAGMNLGVFGVEAVSGRTQSAHLMLTSMGLGMVWSLALSTAVSRTLRFRPVIRAAL